MEGAVHGFQVVFLLVHHHRGVHCVLVEVQVTAGLPQVGPPDVGGVDQVVVMVVVKVAPVVLDQRAHQPALGMPQDQARADVIVNCEEIQLAAQCAVVAFLGFFQPFQVLVQLLLAGKGGAVDALEHGLVLVAAPVGAGNGQQLHRRYIPGGVQMGPLAEVNKAAVPVDRKGFSVGNAFDNLQFIWLVREERLRLFPSQFLAHERLAGVYGLLHKGLNLHEVVGREGPRHVEVIVKPVLGRRADAHFRLGKQL